MSKKSETIVVSKKLLARILCKINDRQKQDLYDNSTKEELKELQQLFAECLK